MNTTICLSFYLVVAAVLLVVTPLEANASEDGHYHLDNDDNDDKDDKDNNFQNNSPTLAAEKNNSNDITMSFDSFLPLSLSSSLLTDGLDSVGDGDMGDVVVVSTISSICDDLWKWAWFHLNVAKFDRIFVFLDGHDPDKDIDDFGREQMQKFGSRLVLLRTRENKFQEALEALPLYDKFGGFYGQEVQARQMLHFALIANRSDEFSVDWALHIDLDELWVPPEGIDAVSHFRSLAVESGITQAVYTNLEAAPMDRDILSQNISSFALVTEFLRSELSFSSRAQHIAVRGLRMEPGRRGLYFQGYWVGKIASRVSTETIFPHDVTRNALPKSVHDLTKIAVFDDTGGPVILHYINPGPEAWRAKYAKRGRFSDRSFDPSLVPREFLEARPHAQKSFPKPMTQLPFSRISRDIVMDESKSDEEKRKIYVAKFALDKNRRRLLRSAAVLVTIKRVARLMRGEFYAHPNSDLQKLPKFKKRKESKSIPAGGITVTSTCEKFPHFVCYAEEVPCCQFLASPAFMFLAHQLGYRK